MSQAEILEVLKKSKLPMAAREIAKSLGSLDKGFLYSVMNKLKKLLENEEIQCIELNRHQALKHFNCKRKLRIYYLNKRDLIKAKNTLAYL